MSLRLFEPVLKIYFLANRTSQAALFVRKYCLALYQDDKTAYGQKFSWLYTNGDYILNYCCTFFIFSPPHICDHCSEYSEYFRYCNSVCSVSEDRPQLVLWLCDCGKHQHSCVSSISWINRKLLKLQCCSVGTLMSMKYDSIVKA